MRASRQTASGPAGGPRRSLLWSTVTVLLLATLTPIVLLGTGGVLVMRGALTDRLAADLDALADSQQQALELVGQRGLDTVRLLTTRTQVRRNLLALLDGDDREEAWLNDALLESRDVVEDLAWIALGDRDGRLVVATEDELVGTRVTVPPAVTDRAGDLVVSEVVPGPDGPVWYLVKVIRDRAEVIGIVAVGLDLAPIAQIVRSDANLARGVTGCVTVAGEDGELIALLEPLGSVLDADTLRQCGAEELFVGVVDRTGSEVVAVVRQVEPMGWVLTLTVASADLYAPVATVTRMVVIVTVLLLAVAAGASVLLARRLTRPLRSLSTAAATLQAGEQRQLADASAPGELGELGERFNTMASALEASRQDLESRYADLELLAHAMAHDLKNPLTMVRGSFDLLSGDRVRSDADRRLLLERGASAAQRMQQLIDDLLVLIRAVGAPVATERVSLDAAVDAVIAELEAAGLITRGPLPVVRGDAVLLGQLVTNLLGNALAYHRPGTQPQVEVSAVPDGEGFVQLRIDDAGVGIAPEERATALAMFERGARTRDRPGTGLGLPIAVRIAERHGGQLKLDDSPLGGTRIVVSLPAADADTD